MAENNYKKYDTSSVGGSEPSTKTIPGSFGRKKGGLAAALGRGRAIDREMGYKKPKKKK